MKETIITITLCISFFQWSIWASWGTYRRSADEIAKIQTSVPPKEKSQGEDKCIEAGGIPEYYSGQFVDCNKK